MNSDNFNDILFDPRNSFWSRLVAAWSVVERILFAEYIVKNKDENAIEINPKHILSVYTADIGD